MRHFKSYVEDIKDLPKDKRRALQKAASTASKKVTLAGPGGTKIHMKKDGDSWKQKDEATGLSRDTLSSYSAKASDARLHKKLPIKKVDNRYSGVAKASKHLDDYNSGKMKEETHDPKHVKMAIGIASDPRYKQGNYTGAHKQIEKIKKGLASHPQVAAVLKKQNESADEDEHLKNAQAGYDKYKGSLGNVFKKHGFKRPTKDTQNRVKPAPTKVKEDVNEGTEFGQTKWVAVNRHAGPKEMGVSVQITGLNGQGKANMDLLKQKGAYVNFPVKDIPKVIKMLQKLHSDK